uniref:Cysteine protease n=1 Tax=Syphacia muris TaxID=451379 RepID=A0A0N5ADW4_9BILA
MDDNQRGDDVDGTDCKAFASDIGLFPSNKLNYLNSLALSAKNATASKLSRATKNIQSFFYPSVAEENASESVEIAVREDSKSATSVKEKLNNAWLSFKYGNWRSKGQMTFSERGTLQLLGSSYFLFEGDSGLQEFLLDYYSRIWLTYRTELQSLPGTLKTTDCGWGCMIRSCQMLVAETLVQLHLGRNWRFSRQQATGIFEKHLKYTYANILSLFSDDKDATLGLCNVLKTSLQRLQRPVDSWYSPSEAVHLFREVLNTCNVEITGGLKLFCVNDGFLIKNELCQISDNFNNPLLLIICIRFGTTKINMIYRDHILSLLSLKNSVGMIGGRPKHSLYFIGSYDSKVLLLFHICFLIYLDPHVVHKAVSSDLQPEYWQIFHSTNVLRISLDKIDPSCAFGFLIRNPSDLEDLLLDFKKCHVIDDTSVGNSTSTSMKTLLSFASQRPALPIYNMKEFETDSTFEIVNFDSSDEDES